MTDARKEMLERCPICKSNDVGSFEREEGLVIICCENDDCPFTVEVCGSTAKEAIQRWNTRSASPSPVKPDCAGTTCYIERSKVREIALDNSYNGSRILIKEAVLAAIDALPIFTAEDFKPDCAEIERATIERCARELEIRYPDHTWVNAYCAAIRVLSVTGEAREGE